MSLKHFDGAEALISQAMAKFKVTRERSDEKDSLRLTYRATEPIWCYKSGLKIPTDTPFIITDLTSQKESTETQGFLLHVAFPTEQCNKDDLIKQNIPCTIDPDTFDIWVEGMCNLAEVTTGVDDPTAADIISLYEAQLAYDTGKEEHINYSGLLGFVLVLLGLMAGTLSWGLQYSESKAVAVDIGLVAFFCGEIIFTLIAFIKHTRHAYADSQGGKNLLTQIAALRQQFS